MALGLALALLATALNTALVARLASTVGGLQSLPAAILGSAAAAMAADWAPPAAPPGGRRRGAGPAAQRAGLGLSTLLTGAVLLALGRLRAGRLVRFIPYPVLAGVIASSAWLLARPRSCCNPARP